MVRIEKGIRHRTTTWPQTREQYFYADGVSR